MVPPRKHLSEFEIMIKMTLSKKTYDIDGKSVVLGDLLNDSVMMNSFVRECPDEAFKLYDSSRGWTVSDRDPVGDVKLYSGAGVAVGEALFLAYSSDSDYGVRALLVGQDLGLTDRVSSRDVEGEAELK
jgi:hypothetical protein